MSDPESLEMSVRRIEDAIEQGGLVEARRLIEDAEERLGPRAELAELRRRLAVVESTLSEAGLVGAAIREARAEMSRANYHAALSVLESAVRKAPHDGELRELIRQTSKAALRHEAAVERNRAVAQAADRVAALAEGGDLEKASSELSEADLRFGKHETLLALRERLETLSKEAELERTVAFVDQARAFLDGGKWPEALRQAERVLRMDPRNPEALEAKRRARAEIERQEAERQAHDEIERAREDVERLISAGETVRASRALENARDRLGRHDVFDQLAGRLDQAKAELQARKRLDWTQRRLKEADDLVREAGRLTLQGRHEQAIERLGKARELHPDHPEIEDMLQAAETALERARAERLRAESLQAARAEVRQLLDALRLDQAEARLEAAVARFGSDDARLQALDKRLRRLREAGSGGLAPPTAAALDGQAATEALRRQRELAQAYSWKQTLLYAFRGEAGRVYWTVSLLFVLLETLAAWLPLGIVFLCLRWLATAAVLGSFSTIVRQTRQGINSWPGWEGFFDLRRRGVDLGVFLGIAALAGLPLALLVVTRGWHGLFAGAAGWGLAAVLGWTAAAFVVLAWVAGATFGYRHVLRLTRHVRALEAGSPQTILAASFVFAVVVVVALLRGVLLPFVPWIGLPAASFAEVFALLVVPHMIGVVARSRRIELARAYETAPTSERIG